MKTKRRVQQIVKASEANTECKHMNFWPRPSLSVTQIELRPTSSLKSTHPKRRTLNATSMPLMPMPSHHKLLIHRMNEELNGAGTSLFQARYTLTLVASCVRQHGKADRGGRQWHLEKPAYILFMASNLVS